MEILVSLPTLKIALEANICLLQEPFKKQVLWSSFNDKKYL